MAFANLFTKLSAVKEDARSPGETVLSDRNQSEHDQRSKARKRKPHSEHTVPYKKKRCYPGQKTDPHNVASFEYDFSKAIHNHTLSTASERASIGVTEKHHHGNKAGHSGHSDKGPAYAGKNNPNVNKRQQKKNSKGNKGQHHMKDRWKHSSKGGHHETNQTLRKKCGKDYKHKGGKQDVPVKRPRFMTQDFMDLNALLVDGQMLCRHFVWGRCIKGDDCQLPHIQVYNDLIKEVCKFYVQGFCMKGESCPYMHKSFPCKFFHRKGKCSQGADCRFSHEPLNEVTNRLLDEALKREHDLYELAKKAEQESAGQPANTDESEINDANKIPEMLIQPLRPNFYNSKETNTEQKALLCQAEEASDDMEEAVGSQTQPQSPVSTQLNHEEPVCYSVEAVLGRQTFKPFCNFFTTSQSQEITPLCVEKTSACTSGTASQDEVPYSVSAVLRSCKSVENATIGHTPTLSPAQIVSYTPKSDHEGLAGHLLSSETKLEKVLFSVSEDEKSQRKMFKSLPSHQTYTGLISKTSPDYNVVSGDHRKQGDTLTPAQRVLQEVKLDLHSSATMAQRCQPSKSKGDMEGDTQRPTYTTHSVNCKSEDFLPFGPTEPTSLASSPKHPTKSKPRVSGLTCNSQVSVQPLCPSSGLSEFKGGAAVSAKPIMSSINKAHSGDSVSRHFTAKQPTEVQLHSKKTQSGLSLGAWQPSSSESRVSRECSSKMAQKIHFHSLFAKPISESMKPTTDSQDVQSSSLSLQSVLCTDEHAEAVEESGKTTSKSFLGLFSSPLSAAPLQCMQPQPDHSRTSSCSQESHHSANSTSNSSNLESPLPHQVKADDQQPSHRSSSPKKLKASEQQVYPACSFVFDSSAVPRGKSPYLSAVQSQQQEPSILSHKGSAVAATADSLLKTLFVCLSPYQQDGEQQNGVQAGVPAGQEKDRCSAVCVFNKQQKSEKRDRKKKKLTTQRSPEKTAAHSTVDQPSFHTSQSSLETTGRPNPCSPATPGSPIRKCGTHALPFKAVTPAFQHHTQPKLKQTPEEGTCVSRNKGVTPLKDLFKTLDTTVFHFGH